MPRPYAFGFTRYASALAPGAFFNSQAGAAAATTGAGAILNGYLSSTNCNELVIDGWVALETSLRLPSHTKLRLLPGSGLYCMNGLNAPAVTNLHWLGSYNSGSPIYNGSMIVDTNISILGEGATIVGNRGNGTVGNCTSGDPRYSNGKASAGVAAGQWISPVTFLGVNGLMIEGIKVYDPPTFGFFLSNCFGVRCRNLTSIDPVTFAGGTPGFGRNTDGFHCVGPIDDLILIGFDCSANDDGVGLNATDGNYTGPNNPAGGTGPVIFGGQAACYAGPITRVKIHDVHLYNSLNGLRFLPGAYAMDGITVDGVRGTTYGASFVGTTFGGTGSGGYIGAASILNWHATQSGLINGPFSISNNARLFKLQVFNQVATGRAPQLLISGGTIDQLDVEMRVSEYGSTTQAPYLSVTGGTVTTARFSGSRTRPGQSATTNPLASITGGTVSHLLLDAVTDDNGGGLVSIGASGAVNDVRVNGCTQANTTATGIATAATVPVLTGAGNYGVTKSGTFTSSSNFASA